MFGPGCFSRSISLVNSRPLQPSTDQRTKTYCLGTACLLFTVLALAPAALAQELGITINTPKAGSIYTLAQTISVSATAIGEGTAKGAWTGTVTLDGTTTVCSWSIYQQSITTESCTATLENPAAGTHTLTWTWQQVTVAPKSGSTTFYVGTSGYINPKYVVLGVFYAPPGSKSYVSYANSTTVSSTHTVVDTSSVSNTVSVSVTASGGLGGYLNGSETSSYSDTVTQESQDTTSVTASFTDTSTFQYYGPGSSNNCSTTTTTASDYVGVDHDCDHIKIWLNPVLLFTVSNGGAVWNGYGYSALDPVAPIHVDDVLVGCLNLDIPSTDSRCAPAYGDFARSWATNENWPSGQGPGLTSDDIAAIVAADPWGNCLPTSAIGASACPTYTTPGFVLLPPQYNLSDQENVPYNQGAQPEMYVVSTTNSTMEGQKDTTTYKQTYGVEDTFKGSGWLAGFSASIGSSQTLTTSYEVDNTTTVTNTVTGTANITPPACTGDPCNPVYPPSPQLYGEADDFDIFVDQFFGTFVFVPSDYN
jgi:hypothetical protein